MGLSTEETMENIKEYIAQLGEFQTLLAGTEAARDKIHFPNSVAEICKGPPK